MLLNQYPVIYSFRRCPYAIRARMAIAISGQQVELREVDLKQKPEEMIGLSPKATVPVLHLSNNEVLEESLDIMHWALAIHDPENWLLNADQPLSKELAKELVETNDQDFKQHLDHYKYADRFPEHSLTYYREKASEFPDRLNSLLAKKRFVFSDKPSFTDVAIFPFIRQFAFVDKGWFDNQQWPHLQHWLDDFLGSELFQSVMKKYQPWKNGDKPVYFLCH